MCMARATAQRVFVWQPLTLRIGGSVEFLFTNKLNASKAWLLTENSLPPFGILTISFQNAACIRYWRTVPRPPGHIKLIGQTVKQ